MLGMNKLFILKMHAAVVIVIVVIILTAFVIWAIYNVSAAHQQTITVNSKFINTYRHVPTVNNKKHFRLSSIKVTISGSVTQDGILIMGKELKDLINKNIIEQYKDTLLLHESSVFMIDTDLKRFGMTKIPTVENLSVYFFNKLRSLTNFHVLEVSVISNGIESSYTRYKPNTYFLG